MANTRISNAGAIAALDALLGLLDAGGAGSIEIRTGAPPTNVEDADSGTLLGTLTLSATAFGGATDGTDKASASAASITGESSAPAGGTAGHFRAKSGAGTAVIQGDVTASAGGGDLELDTTTVNSGDTIDISAWTVNLPET